MLRARVEVRLEARPPRGRAPSVRAAVERGAHLGRVVGVVVVHARRRARSCRARSKRRSAPVKLASAGAASAGATPASRQRRERRERVQHVVAAGHVQLDRARRRRVKREPRRRRARRRARRSPALDPVALRRARRAAPRPARPGAARSAATNSANACLHARRRAVGGVVVELDVRDHRDVRARASGTSGRTRRPRPRSTRPLPQAAFVPVERSSPPIR